MRNRLAVALAMLTLTGCNSYDYFRLTGAVQESFSARADILFVIDNSRTMTDESEALAESFASFIGDFADSADAPTDPTLTDAVSRYIDFVVDPAGNLNYQLGITTTNASGEWGELHGSPNFLTKTDNNIDRKFNTSLLCEAACIDEIPAGINVTCPDGPIGNCADSAAGSREEGIEAVFMALCRSVENPPAACFQEWWNNEDIVGGVQDTQPGSDTGGTPPIPPLIYFTDEHVGSNGTFIRENSTIIPVIVTDEGDKSRRIPNGDIKTDRYDALFSLFPNRMAWAVIGPTEDGCNTEGSSSWQIDRYRRMVEASNGVYIPIKESDGAGGCDDAPFDEALTRIGDLLRALTDTFPLRALPLPDTIVVTVDGIVVDEAQPALNEELGLTVYDDGWSYNVANNSVVLHGDAVPDFDAQVRVWYLPAAGVPRDLPF
jgi:hypothetical protein